MNESTEEWVVEYWSKRDSGWRREWYYTVGSPCTDIGIADISPMTMSEMVCNVSSLATCGPGDWVVEYWKNEEWRRDWTFVFAEGVDAKRRLRARRLSHIRDYPPMEFQEAMDLAKERENTTRQARIHFPFRIRNIKTGDILPAAIL